MGLVAEGSCFSAGVMDEDDGPFGGVIGGVMGCAALWSWGVSAAESLGIAEGVEEQTRTADANLWCQGFIHGRPRGCRG